MAQTVAAIDSILRDVQPALVDQTAEELYLFSTVNRDADFIRGGGRRVLVPVMTRHNRQYGARGDNSLLPSPSQRTLSQLEYTWSYHYQGMAITDPTIAHSKGQGALESELKAEMDSLTEGFTRGVAREWYGLGTGAAATVDATDTTNNTISVDREGIQYLQVGDVIDVVVTATGAVAAEARTITDIDEANRDLTVDGATFTKNSTHSVCFTGNWSFETEGLRSLTDNTNTTIGGVDGTAAGNEWWQPISHTPDGGANATADESDFEQFIDALGEPEVLLTTRGIRRRLADEFTSTKRFNDGQATKIHGGFSAIWIDEVPVVKDRFCPKRYVFGYKKKGLSIFELEPMGWFAEDGQRLRLSTSGRNVWEAYWKYYAALGSKHRRSLGRISTCADDAPIGAYEA